MTPAHRANLRALKAEFDEAVVALDGSRDRSSEAFRLAEARFKVWMRAIDAQALALLDDLDAYESGEGSASPAGAARKPGSPVEPVRSGEVDRVFAEMEDLMHAREIISPEDDTAEFT